MPQSLIADSGMLVALLSHADQHHSWARSTATQYSAPWITCEPVITECFFLLEDRGIRQMTALLRSGALSIPFSFDREMLPVLTLMEKYADVPMSLADACIVRMSEILPDPLVFTTDTDFRIYRRHSRQIVPCLCPPQAR